MTHVRCKARQYSDQMNCHDCSLVWDMNDLDPPTCGLLVGVEDFKRAVRGGLGTDKGFLNSYRAAKDGE